MQAYIISFSLPISTGFILTSGPTIHLLCFGFGECNIIEPLHTTNEHILVIQRKRGKCIRSNLHKELAEGSAVGHCYIGFTV